jgi:hypothetical protein
MVIFLRTIRVLFATVCNSTPNAPTVNSLVRADGHGRRVARGIFRKDGLNRQGAKNAKNK